jgi:hypothetical protein
MPTQGIGDRPKGYAEPSFDYYNASSRADVAALRRLLDSWYRAFPAEAAAELRQRFRSRIERQHQGAFYELCLHELPRRLRYEAEVHPVVDEPTHPDFLIRRAGERRFYLSPFYGGPI